MRARLFAVSVFTQPLPNNLCEYADCRLTYPRRPGVTKTVFTVTGMTCGHCVQAVTTEVSRVDGVSAVDVDLETGAVTVTSESPINHAAVIAAVEEAGYQVQG